MGIDKAKQSENEEYIRQRLLKESPYNTINGNFQFTACVGTNGGYDQSTIYTGFKDAVDTLIDSIGEYRNQADAMVYPVLFCIRHCIELFLKRLHLSLQYIKDMKNHRDSFIRLKKLATIRIRLADNLERCEWVTNNFDDETSNAIIEKTRRRQETLESRLNIIQSQIDLCTDKCSCNNQNEEFTHDLNDLIERVVSIYQVDDRIREAFDRVLPLLSYYKDIDPKGDAFRYWSDRDGHPHFETKEIGIVKLDIVAVQFQEICEQFTQIDFLIWYLRKEYGTGTFTKDLTRKQIEEIAQSLPKPNEFNEKIKEVKEKIKKKYKIGSNKFDSALEIIRKHREFSSYMGKEIMFSFLSDKTLRIFAECSLSQRKWKDAACEVPMQELQLLFTFSDISGWRYHEKSLAYFSEDLRFLFSETTRRSLSLYDINPVSEAKYVIAGMKKCGQITYASTIEKHLSDCN